MAVRKIRNSWWVDFRSNNVRYRRRSPENSRAGAQAFELVLRQKLAHDGAPGATALEGVSFEEFAWQWFNDYVKTNNKYSEQYAKEKILRAELIPYFGPLRVGKIGASDIERFKAKQKSRGASNKTINNRLTVLGKCLNTASEWFGIQVPRIKLLKCPPPVTTYLTTGECELLLQNSEGVIHEMVILALRGGLRQAEIRGLQWESIDWQNRSLVVRHAWYDRLEVLVSTKTYKERHIPIDTDLYELLGKRKALSGFVFIGPYDKPFTSHRLIDELAAVCRRSGIRKVGWHVLRHTFATQLAMHGTPLPLVQSLLGHSTINMTSRYAHVAPSALRSAIDLLNPKNAAYTDLGHQAVNLYAKWITSNHQNL